MAAPGAATSTDTVWRNTVDFINREFGDDVDNLPKSVELYEDIKKTKDSLELQLSFASSEAPSLIDKAVKDAEATTASIQRLTTRQELLSSDIANQLADSTSLVKTLSGLTNQIKELERYSKYLQLIGRIDDLSSDIRSALIIESVERSVSSFSDLADLVNNLQSSRCHNLVTFANNTVIFWYKILKDRFSSEFDEVLKAHQWPFIVSSAKAAPPLQNATETKAKLGDLFNNLLHLQLPEGLSTEGKPSHPLLANLPGWRPLILPLQLMLRPLRKRFRFHFHGKKQTNSLDKPEWYFTVILTWVRDHRKFLVTNIQPILDKAGLQYVDAVVEFTRGLVILAMEKMLSDISDMLYDESIFSHLIDETLTFDQELRTGYGYPSSQPSCLHVLIQDVPFSKWILIERKFALEKMDDMLSSPTAWHSQYKDIADVDDRKVPECGEAFMTLMLTITERYKSLPSKTHQLRFLELQLELLDDYRLRLFQIKKGEEAEPLGRIFCAILNTVFYTSEVLNDWTELEFFLQLQYQKTLELESTAAPSTSSKQEDDEQNVSKSSILTRSLSSALQSVSKVTSTDEMDVTTEQQIKGTVFDEMIKLLVHVKDDMLDSVVSYIVDDVKARSRPYRKDKWLALPSQKDLSALGLSVSACEMLFVLKNHLLHMQTQLCKPLFTALWQKVAEQLNKFIYKDVILSNFFNDGGASQLNFDMTRNLFPLFGQYTQKPENYFKDVKEACIVLSLPVGSALLLKEVLYEALHSPTSDPNARPTDPVAALHDINIYKLEPEDVELILSLRTNLST